MEFVTRALRTAGEGPAGLTRNIEGNSVVLPVPQKVLRIVEATAFEPLGDVSNPFRRVHNLQRTRHQLTALPPRLPL
jgi:hypothetical protein